MLHRVLWVQFVAGRYFHITTALKPQSVYSLLKLQEDPIMWFKQSLMLAILPLCLVLGPNILLLMLWKNALLGNGCLLEIGTFAIFADYWRKLRFLFLSIPTLIDPLVNDPWRGPELGHISAIIGTQLLWRQGPKKWLEITACTHWLAPSWANVLGGTSNTFNLTSLACCTQHYVAWIFWPHSG